MSGATRARKSGGSAGGDESAGGGDRSDRPGQARVCHARLLRQGNAKSCRGGCLRTYAAGVPRRRVGVLLPLEEEILEVGLRRLRDGEPDFYGFAMATELDGADGRRLTAHGTLYKVLERLERNGLLVSRWEDVDEVDEGRPRRRLYRVSEKAAGALQQSRSLQAKQVLRPGLATR
jgi:hypothetical protein